MDFQNMLKKFGEWLVADCLPVLVKVVLGLILVLILFKIINKISRKLEKKMIDSPKIDTTTATFIAPIVRKSLKVVIILCYIGFIGIETSSIVGVITGSVLSIGLALQGALSNLAGGFLIMLLKPFKVGDYVSCGGESGTVESIQVFYTVLVTPDNKVIRIPNGTLTNANITNVSEKKTRRVDVVFPIGYDSDSELAIKLIKECVDKTGLCVDESKTFVKVVSHSASSIDISCRVWVKNEKYWDMYFTLLEDVRKKFNENNIEIPYSKFDINVINK